MSARAPRRTYRFSLRSLFGLIVLASLVAFAAHERSRRVHLEKRFVELREEIHRQVRVNEHRQQMLNHQLDQHQRTFKRYKHRQAISQWQAQGASGSNSRRPST
jgi:hypothetical protein